MNHKLLFSFALAIVAAVSVSRAASSQVVNMSTKLSMSVGAAPTTIGFVVTGDRPVKMLLRAVGPTLKGYGIPGFGFDPLIEVHGHGSTELNDDWSASSDMTSAVIRTGAFPLLSGSRDAAILLTLPPGVYSAVVRLNAKPGTYSEGSGEVLVEAYVVPE